MRVFVDTSALYALLDRDDLNHADAERTFRGLGPDTEFLTHNYVHVEAGAVVQRRLGRDQWAHLVDKLLPAISTVWVDEALHEACVATMRASGRSVSLVDQVSFEVMRREGIEIAFAYDADFDRAGFRRPKIAADPSRRLSEAPAPYSSVAVGDDLVSVAEVAERAGTSVNTVQSWRRRHKGFPRPLVTLAAGPVWDWPTVEAWIDTRRSSDKVARAGYGDRPYGF
jgi:predicted nucleic acid-binding protein